MEGEREKQKVGNSGKGKSGTMSLSCRGEKNFVVCKVEKERALLYKMQGRKNKTGKKTMTSKMKRIVPVRWLQKWLLVL